jgi:hypothetical protein
LSPLEANAHPEVSLVIWISVMIGNSAEGSNVLRGPISIVGNGVADATAVADGTAVSVVIVVSVGELVRVKSGVGKSSGVVVFILGV